MHRLSGWNCARFEGDDKCVRFDPRVRIRYANGLNGAHATAHQHVGQIRRTCEIVGDTAEQCLRHYLAPFGTSVPKKTYDYANVLIAVRESWRATRMLASITQNASSPSRV